MRDYEEGGLLFTFFRNLCILFFLVVGCHTEGEKKLYVKVFKGLD